MFLNKVLQFSIILSTSSPVFLSADAEWLDVFHYDAANGTLLEQYEKCRLEEAKRVEFSISNPRLLNCLTRNVYNYQFDISSLKISNTMYDVPQSGKVKLWPKNEIPILMDSSLTYSQTKSLACAFKYFNAYSCINFMHFVNGQHNDYVRITNKGDGCYSDHVGMNGGEQLVNLESCNIDCWKHGTVVHELLHVVGFFHEQARDDRDQHIVVHWENIPKDQNLIRQFNTTSELGFDHPPIGQYDYASVMHYKRDPFVANIPIMSANKNPRSAYKFNNMMGQRDKPTEEDTRKINILYNCPDPIGCEVSEWSKFGACSVTCGNGTRKRNRSVLHEPVSNGKPCPALMEIQQCAVEYCSPDEIEEPVVG